MIQYFHLRKAVIVIVDHISFMVPPSCTQTLTRRKRQQIGIDIIKVRSWNSTI